MKASFAPKKQEQGRKAPQKDSQSALSYPSRTFVHAKLEMTSPDDWDELEADAVADEVVRGGKIARKISGSGDSSGIAVPSQMESRLSQSRGGGQPMPRGLRSMMESAFGQEFPNVRIHTDAEAASMSSRIHAKAFTHGNDIYFNQGQFSPGTADGQRLVAHELTHVVQAQGNVARKPGDGGEKDYAKEIIDRFDSMGSEYSRGDLLELFKKIDEYELDWLLYTHPEFFRTIYDNDIELLKKIWQWKKRSFLWLRYHDLKKLDYIICGDDFSFVNYYNVFGSHYMTELKLMDRERENYLNMSDRDTSGLDGIEYHSIKRSIVELLPKEDVDFAFLLSEMDKLSNYDFCDLLVNNQDMERFIWDLYYEEFVLLFKPRIDALRYLYHMETEAFYRIFNDEDCETLNKEILRPQGRGAFIGPTQHKLLQEKKRLQDASGQLRKALSKIMEEERKRSYFENEEIKWYGNEDVLELKDLRGIVDFVNLDLNKVSALKSVKENLALIEGSKTMLSSVEKRLNMYVRNIKNGEVQKQLIDYIGKTVTVSLVSAGIGAGVGAVYSGGVLFNVVVSGVTGTVIEVVTEAASDDEMSGVNIGKSGATGVAGGLVSEAAHLVIPGPAGKFLADVLIGAASSWVGDSIQGSDPKWLPDEVHDDALDIALYAYYMAKIGGIAYDEDAGKYYVKKEEKGSQSKKRQYDVVEKLNKLIKRTQ